MNTELPFHVIAREWMDAAVVVPFAAAAAMFGLTLLVGIRRDGRRSWYSDPWVKSAAALLTLMTGSMLHNDWIWLLLWGVGHSHRVFYWLENLWWTGALGQLMVFVATVCIVRIWTPADWRQAEWYRRWWLRPWAVTVFGALVFVLAVHWKDMV